MPESLAARKPVSLALQGGGSHGAFTWGVLDALLEDGTLAFDGISGTSAGAMNAVAIASGFAEAAATHQDPALVHLQGAVFARKALTRLWEGVGSLGGQDWASSMVMPAMAWLTPWLAPAQSNLFDLNPLRDLLKREIDFENIAAQSDRIPRVFVCATNVRTGRGRIFSGDQLDVASVMASACLPMVFKPVEIDGEAYWDGGYSGNPALYPLIYQSSCSDLLLVQINPIEHPDIPDTVPEIMDRMNEITFNACLLAELRAIGFVKRLLDEGKLDRSLYRSIRMHRVDGGAALAEFGAASKGHADMAFLRKLFHLGRGAATEWLATHRADVGVRATLEVEPSA